jgi:exopolyphosphatase/guanosine-5'-triphosphate,3'-diphosphate pyrophosphatase
VHALARRCNWAEGHARHVAELSLTIFDQTQELHELDSDARELLEYAALLHDIGEHVSPTGHHKHGAYVIENGQLRGFAPAEVQLLAALARWHRRGDPKATDEFPLIDVELVRKLEAILRLADGLDRSRAGAVADVDVRIGPSLVVIGIHARGDVELELWGARRKRELFEKVYERDLEVTVHPSDVTSGP